MLFPLAVWIREDRSLDGDQHERHHRPSRAPADHETASANVEAGKDVLEVIEHGCSLGKLGCRLREV